MLIDSNVRRLVGLHFHVVRKFGTQAATVHEWSAIKENCDKNRDESTRHDFVYPKAAYGWYKSAEVHTHKARIPMRVWVLLCVPVVLAGLVWFGYSRWQAKLSAPPPSKVEEPAKPSRMSAGMVTGGAPAAGEGIKPAVLTTADYLRNHVPRVAGLPYTAPVYDDVTKPTEAPYPAAWVVMGSRCQCYSQQATKLDVPAQLCRDIAAGGFFVAWAGPKAAAGMASAAPTTTPLMTASRCHRLSRVFRW